MHEEPFQYHFYDDELSSLYQKDRQAATLINASTGAAIHISCMGLFGLMLFNKENKAKEISIMKVFGATIYSIIAILSRQIVRTIIVAFIIASPLPYYFLFRWLNAFASRIPITWDIFASSLAAVILIASATIGALALKAAMKNSVANLKEAARKPQDFFSVAGTNS